MLSAGAAASVRIYPDILRSDLNIDILIKLVPIERIPEIAKDLDEYRTKVKFDRIVSRF